ncbi:MAG: group 1 glycosyl transferase [Paenibacillaceae bacterium]|jgi:glycosyltransferase involved in cell wall biosynthesis|nr:group 1 glycosyl transferase [Paenibacillaceae bacterium]
MPQDNLHILTTGLSWPTLQPGGLNTYFQSICEKLAGNNRLQAFICSAERPATRNRLAIHPVASPRMSIYRRQQKFRQHSRLLMDKEQIDIVYSHFAPYSLGTAKEAKKRNIPVVMVFHGPWNQEMRIEGAGLKHALKTWMALRIERQAYALADLFIVLSETFRQILHKQYGIPLEKIVVIPGAANVERFFPPEDKRAVRRKLGLDESALTVLTVRRLVNRMGLQQLLEAWRQVADRFPEAVLLIGGKGHLKEELEGLIIEYGLSGRVKLLGYIPEEQLGSYYQAADLFVVPSQALEGFGLITVEAMACGTPVMATPVGGNQEILGNFRKELLFAGTGSGDIAQGLAQMLSRREEWPTPQECRQFILEHYTWEHVTRKMEHVFHSVLEERGRRVRGS